MESQSIGWPFEDRLHRVEEKATRIDAEHTATKADITQINERLDRAARAGYFLGTSFIALAGTVIGAVLAG